MRWIDKYNKEKERKFKEEHSSITIEQLNDFFIKYLKMEGDFGEYIWLLYCLLPHSFFRKNFLHYITARYTSNSSYLNENFVYKLYAIIDYEWLKTYNDTLQITLEKASKKKLEDFVHKHIDGFIKFLRKYGYIRYIKVTNDGRNKFFKQEGILKSLM